MPKAFLVKKDSRKVCSSSSTLPGDRAISLNAAGLERQGHRTLLSPEITPLSPDITRTEADSGISVDLGVTAEFEATGNNSSTYDQSPRARDVGSHPLREVGGKTISLLGSQKRSGTSQVMSSSLNVRGVEDSLITHPPSGVKHIQMGHHLREGRHGDKRSSSDSGYIRTPPMEHHTTPHQRLHTPPLDPRTPPLDHPTPHQDQNHRSSSASISQSSTPHQFWQTFHNRDHSQETISTNNRKRQLDQYTTTKTTTTACHHSDVIRPLELIEPRSQVQSQRLSPLSDISASGKSHINNI